VSEANGHGLSPFVILHSNDASLRCRGSIFTGYRNAIGKFERQSRHKNRVLRAAELENSCLPKLRSPQAPRRNLHGNAYGAHLRKKPGKLFGAILRSVDERRCVSLLQVTHVLNAADFPDLPVTQSSRARGKNSGPKHHERPWQSVPEVELHAVLQIGAVGGKCESEERARLTFFPRVATR
jgi:hypothetical protein